MIGRALVLAPLLALAAAAPPPARPAQETTQILIVYAHDPNSPGVTGFAGQLKAAVRAEFPTRLEIYDEYLYLDRFRLWCARMRRPRRAGESLEVR